MEFTLPSLAISFHSREQLILSKMSEIRVAQEQTEKAEQQKKLEDEIAAEALYRVESEKLQEAINYNDLNKICALAGIHDGLYKIAVGGNVLAALRRTAVCSHIYNCHGSPCTIVKQKAIMFLLQYEKLKQKQTLEEEQKKLEQKRIAKEAFDKAQKEAKFAEIPTKDLILQLNDLKTNGERQMLWLCHYSSTAANMDREDGNKRYQEMKSDIADYEWELNKRIAMDSTINTLIRES